MGSDGSSSASNLYNSLSLTSQSLNRSGIAAFRQLVAAQRACFTSVANYVSSLYRNDTVNWGQVVFLSTCVITMAGCGLITSFIRRRWSRKGRSSSRGSVRKTSSTKSNKSTKTLTSSDDDYEDDDYDSNGSLRHGTDPNQTKATEWSAEPQQQSSDGKKISWRTRVVGSYSFLHL